MYKLYNVKAWGSLSIHCLLEEMEVPYTNIWMTAEQVRAPEFRAISPLGQVPALGLADGRALFESAAIITFLVTAHPDKAMAPAVGSEDFGEFLSWLQFLATNLYITNNLAFPGSIYAADAAHDAFVAGKAAERADSYWQLLEDRLGAEGPWLMGEDYSALDIYMFMITLWGRPSEAELRARFPRIAAHAGAVRARPKLKAALEAHGVMEVGGYPPAA